MSVNADLHVEPVEAARVRRTFARLAPIYDVIYGALLAPGRRRAVTRMALGAGDRVLEVGVGTGQGLEHYPSHAHIVGIDLCAEMLERARTRVAALPSSAHIELREMDASAMDYPSGAFDVVYAPYVLNVVPDPMAVASEMRRVCKPGGRIVLLNHFREQGLLGRLDDIVSKLSGVAGTRWDLPLEPFLRDTPLHPISIERVNILGFTSLIVCKR